jgi:hypothetical protein
MSTDLGLPIFGINYRKWLRVVLFPPNDIVRIAIQVILATSLLDVKKKTNKRVVLVPIAILEIISQTNYSRFS